MSNFDLQAAWVAERGAAVRAGSAIILLHIAVATLVLTTEEITTNVLLGIGFLAAGIAAIPLILLISRACYRHLSNRHCASGGWGG